MLEYELDSLLVFGKYHSDDVFGEVKRERRENLVRGKLRIVKISIYLKVGGIVGFNVGAFVGEDEGFEIGAPVSEDVGEPLGKFVGDLEVGGGVELGNEELGSVSNICSSYEVKISP